MPAGNPASSVSLNLVSAPPPTLEKPTPENVEPPKEPQPQNSLSLKRRSLRSRSSKRGGEEKVVEKSQSQLSNLRKWNQPKRLPSKLSPKPNRRKNRTGEERYGYSANCISEPIQRGNISAYFGRQTNVCESTNAAPLSKICTKTRYRRRSLV